jgi:acyl-CoA thioester hydrolase
MGSPHRTTHRLRFNDTDRLGHVNNAVFAVMLEQGRSELAAEAGLPLDGGAQTLVIVRLELDFVREMGWPGDVEVETWVARLGGRSFQLRQRLLHGGHECGRALTVLCVLDRATGRAGPIEPAWRETLARWHVADPWADPGPDGG